MDPAAPALPSEQEWVALGFDRVTELRGGWQSRVFSAQAAAGTLAVKLTPAHLAERKTLEQRAALMADLASVDASVVTPVAVCGSLVHPFGEWLVAATYLTEGDRLEESIPAHCELLGESLAGLHRSMRAVPAMDLPRVAALRCDPGRWGSSVASDQLLHGDFNTSNLLLTDAGIRIFDFDDCGYGPIEFDIANSIYMVGFESWTKEGTMAGFNSFRSAFMAGYARCSDRILDDASIDSLIEVRIRALQRWTANPSAAPIGIRNSPAEWIETLDRFVREWFGEQDGSLSNPR